MTITRLFWNPDEHRLRAGWRVLIQLVVAGMLVAGFTTLFRLFLGNALSFRLGPLVGFTVAVWLAGRFLDRRRFVDFGFSLDARWWADFAFGLVLGTLLMTGIFAVEYGMGWLTITETMHTTTTGQSFFVALCLSLLSFVAVGFYEELVFRGYQVQNMAEGFNGGRMGPRRALIAAWLLSAALFGMAHAFNPNASLVSTLNIAGAGLLLGLGYVLTRQLALPFGIHIAWNFTQGNVFGFPVSGGSNFAAQVLVIRQGGPDVWTGGAFGPEAGLLGLAAMALGAALTVAWIWYRYNRIAWQTELARAPVVHQPDPRDE